MTLPRPCLVCGDLIATGSRCADCTPPRLTGRRGQARRTTILTRDRRACTRCGATNRPLEVDHIVPLAHGGNDTSANLRVLCVPCHRSRTRSGPVL